MDVIQRIDELMDARGWSDYRLSIESNLSPSTIANIHRRKTLPSIPTLEAICDAFGISLSQFFADEKITVQLNREQQSFFSKWSLLSNKQRQLLMELVEEFN